MKTSKIDKRVVEGIRLPNDGPASQNEMQWLQLLRLVFRDDVPAPQMGIARARQMLGVDFHPELSRFFHREVSHL